MLDLDLDSVLDLDAVLDPDLDPVSMSADPKRCWKSFNYTLYLFYKKLFKSEITCSVLSSRIPQANLHAVLNFVHAKNCSHYLNHILRFVGYCSSK